MGLIVVQAAVIFVLVVDQPPINQLGQGLVIFGAGLLPALTAVFFTRRRRFRKQILLSVITFAWLTSSPVLTGYPLVWMMLLPLLIIFHSAASLQSTAAAAVLMTMPLMANLLIGDEAGAASLLVVSSTIITMALLWHYRENYLNHNNPQQVSHVSDQQFVALINSMADGVIATDPKLKIKLYNGATLSILNVNTSLEGKDASSYLPITDSDGKSVNLKKIISSMHGYFMSRDFKMVFPDGDVTRLYVAITDVKPSYGRNEGSGYVILLRDITREKSLEEERDEFISVVSHELRTPVAITEGSISNAMLLMNKSGTKKKVLKLSLEEAHKQAVFLSGLINDLSTLSRAERGVLNADPETIDPNKFIKQIAKDYRQEAKDKGLYIKVNTDRSAKKINTAKLYLHEIIQNFVTNAIKYTKKGGLTLSVEGMANGATFKVKDSGIGISKSDQKKVFDKFFRSEDFRTRESSGTGLGLYVTIKLAKIIGAKIDIQSALNQGSTFSVEVHNIKNKTNQ